MRSGPSALCAMLLSLSALVWADGKAPLSPADKLWGKAIKATDADQWDESRKLLEQFLKKHPEDPRAGEARERLSGNTLLKIVPFCINGPQGNRIDLYMSGDGLTFSAEDQDLLRHIVDTQFEEALRLAPFDVYWSYFNWHRVHAASAIHGVNTTADDRTCFGGRHGRKGCTDGDAFVDTPVCSDFAMRHFPDYDLFLVWVDGWNGWPRGYNICAVGTTNFRYLPRLLSAERLDDAEMGPASDMVYPELKERFDLELDRFRKELAKERERYANLTVRQWRALTATWKMQMVKGEPWPKGNPGGKRPLVWGKRDPKTGRNKADGGPLNTIGDTRSFPGMDPRDRPLPSLDTLPWYHWLLKEEPGITVLPVVQISLWGFGMRQVKAGAPWEEAITLPKPGKKQVEYDEMMKRYKGPPSKDVLLDKLRICYYPHKRCHLGGGATQALGGFNKAPQYCALCREETVRGIYRYVNPIDDAEPKEERVEAEAGKKVEFRLFPMKPLDHYLTVEWTVDGKPVEGAKRTLVDRETGKSVSVRNLPLFPVRRREQEVWDAKTHRSGSSKEQVACALAHARCAVVETLKLDPSKLAPGEHRVEATVIDETPWVLWDPENLLTERRSWTLTVPQPPSE